uniref:ATP-binding protein n=1 Tax=Rhabditophanes sp. KR3021 TaxID=114890 RepID=A0AC35TJK8_9BILA
MFIYIILLTRVSHQEKFNAVCSFCKDRDINKAIGYLSNSLVYSDGPARRLEEDVVKEHIKYWVQNFLFTGCLYKVKRILNAPKLPDRSTLIYKFGDLHVDAVCLIMYYITKHKDNNMVLANGMYDKVYTGLPVKAALFPSEELLEGLLDNVLNHGNLCPEILFTWLEYEGKPVNTAKYKWDVKEAPIFDQINTGERASTSRVTNSPDDNTKEVIVSFFEVLRRRNLRNDDVDKLFKLLPTAYLPQNAPNDEESCGSKVLCCKIKSHIWMCN